MPRLELLLLQTAPHWHDAAANRELFGELIGRAPAATQVAVLPEMFSTGFTMQAARMAEPMSGPTVRWMRDTAAASGIALAGSVAVEAGGERYNRFVWAPPGEAPVVYDKRHPFRMAGEHEHYAAGPPGRVVVRLGEWRLLPVVCYDLRFPVWMRSRGDYDVIVCVANWPAARQAAWDALLRARAVENQCYVVAVNRLGTDGNGVVYAGGSGAYGFYGDALVEAGDREGAVAASLDLGELRRHREEFPAWLDADEFELGAGADG